MHPSGAFEAKLVTETQARAFMHRNGGGDRAAAWIAARQLSVITGEQLALAGLTRRALARRCERGLVSRFHRGVYLWGSPIPLPGATELAAQLACGPCAYVSHHSAATLWGLVDRPDPAGVHVTVVGSHRHHRPGLHVHETRHLAAADRATVRGIPVTSVARTLLDLAACAPSEQLETAVSEAYARRLVTDRALTAALDRAPKRPGSAALRAYLRFGPSPIVSRSRFERRMRTVLSEAGLALPQTNVAVEGFTVDFFWPDARLVVEADGYGAHGHRAAFERDRRRDAALVAAGYRVIRVTWRQLTEQPLLVVANIARALAHRGA